MQMVQIFTYKHGRCHPQARFCKITTFAWNPLSSLFRVPVYTINELPGQSGPPRSAPAAWQMRAAAHGEGKYKGTPILSLLHASVHSSRRFSVLGEETCNVVWQSLHTAGLEVISRRKNSALDFTCSPTPIHQSCFHSIVLYLLLLAISDTCCCQHHSWWLNTVNGTTHDLEMSMDVKMTSSLYHPALVNGGITGTWRQRTNFTVLN